MELFFAAGTTATLVDSLAKPRLQPYMQSRAASSKFYSPELEIHFLIFICVEDTVFVILFIIELTVSYVLWVTYYVGTNWSHYRYCCASFP